MNSKNFDLITLDGQLLDDDHGRDVLKEMSDKQIAKTIVYSADSMFIEECRVKGIKAAEKNGYLIHDLIVVNENSIEIKV